jgi:hypothetical protein
LLRGLVKLMSRTQEQLDFVRTQKTECINYINSLQRNAGALLGVCALHQEPQKFLKLTECNQFLRMDKQQAEIWLPQSFGLDLTDAKQKKSRIEELGAQTKRILVVEALEIFTDKLVTAVKYLSTSKDPYQEGRFEVDCSELQLNTKGKAGYYLSINEKSFLRAMTEIRNVMRHNSGRIPPQKMIGFERIIQDTNPPNNIWWKQGLFSEDGVVAASIGYALMCSEYFKTITEVAFDRIADPNYKPQ